MEPSAALGINSTFDATAFRNGIRFAMQMGAPPDVTRQATFVFPAGARRYERAGVVLAAAPRLDRDGRPFDPTVAVIVEPGRQVVVDCAVEITRADADEGPAGTFRHTKAMITVLDEQYALVKGCAELLFNGDKYVFGYEPEGLGLFSVGVNTMIFYARDET